MLARVQVSALRKLVTNSPRAVQGGRDEEGLWEALIDEIDEAVGEPLHPIGEPPASVKDVYEKQPVSAPLALFVCELCNPLTERLPICE